MPGNLPLSLQEMERVIDSGGSVLHQGVIITDKRLLPTPAQLARTPEDREKVRLDMIAQRARLDAQIKAIESGTEATAAASPPPEPIGTATPLSVVPEAGAPPDEVPATDAGPTDLEETGEDAEPDPENPGKTRKRKR